MYINGLLVHILCNLSFLFEFQGHFWPWLHVNKGSLSPPFKGCGLPTLTASPGELPFSSRPLFPYTWDIPCLPRDGAWPPLVKTSPPLSP